MVRYLSGRPDRKKGVAVLQLLFCFNNAVLRWV